MVFWDRWKRKGLTARDPDLYTLMGGSETWAGERVSTEGALNLSAFWAASRITAQTVASLSFDVMEKGADGVKVRAPDHWLQPIIDSSPNADQTAIEFWEGRVLGLCTSGNAFAEKAFLGSKLTALNRMPADTDVSRNSDGALQYRFSDRGKDVVLPEEKVFHVRAFGDGDVGLSPVAYARQTLSLTTATEKAAGHAYSKGLRSKGFFIMPAGAKPLNDEQRKDAKKSLVDANSGSNAPWAGILEGGVDFKTVSLSMRDAEMILNRRFNVEEVCRWLGVPPIIIGHSSDGQTMWGTGVASIMQAWLTFGLRSYIKRIEQAIEKRLLTPVDRLRYSIKINYEDLLRGDSAARATFYKILLDAGVMTINEVRKIEGLPPVPGGDIPRIQTQNQPISDATGHNGGPPIGANE
ncbi:phage portal protein [Rhizobium sp. A37_96]